MTGAHRQKLSFVCLALLAEQPASGYDIRRAIRSSELRHYVGHGQATIYAVLKDLEERGLVGSTRRAVAGRPDQNVFHLLPKTRDMITADAIARDDFGAIPILLRFRDLVPRDEIVAVVRYQLSSAESEPTPALASCRAGDSISQWQHDTIASFRQLRTTALAELLDLLSQARERA